MSLMPVETSALRRRIPSSSQATLLLVADVRMALVLLNQARYRTLERVLGLGREEANLATLVIVVAVAEASRNRASRWRRLIRPPGVSDMALGAAAMRESIYGVAGKSSDQMPLAATLVTIAVAAHLASPVIRRTATAIRASTRGLHRALDRQYGRVRGAGSEHHELAGEPRAPDAPRTSVVVAPS